LTRDELIALFSPGADRIDFPPTFLREIQLVGYQRSCNDVTGCSEWSVYGQHTMDFSIGIDAATGNFWLLDRATSLEPQRTWFLEPDFVVGGYPWNWRDINGYYYKDIPGLPTDALRRFRFAVGENGNNLCVEVTSEVHRSGDLQVYAMKTRAYTLERGPSSNRDSVPAPSETTRCADAPLATAAEVAAAWFDPGSSRTALVVDVGENWNRSCHPYTGCSGWIVTSPLRAYTEEWSTPRALVVRSGGIGVEFELVPDGTLTFVTTPLTAGQFTYYPEPAVGGTVTGRVAASCIGFQYTRLDGSAITNLTQAKLRRFTP
jgi:hypothetical protein